MCNSDTRIEREEMTPTMKLRFIERADRTWDDDIQCRVIVLKRVLQQWWAYDRGETVEAQAGYNYTTGEWVDVPLEEEL